MKYYCCCIDYTEKSDQAIAHLFCRDEKRNPFELQVYGIKPFFYVDADTKIIKSDRIVSVERLDDWKSVNGTKIKKISMKVPSDVGGNRKDKSGYRIYFANTYEDDILFKSRIWLELNLKNGFIIDTDKPYIDYEKDSFIPTDFIVPMRRSHIDIEVGTIETNGYFPSYADPVNPIYCLTAMDTYELSMHTYVNRYDLKNTVIHKRYKCPLDKKYGFKEYYDVYIHTYQYEKDMLQAYLTEHIQIYDHDVYTGWNLQNFDMPYLVARGQKIGCDVSLFSRIGRVYVDKLKMTGAYIKGRIVFDTMLGYKKTVTSEEDFGLDAVSMKLFSVGKIKKPSGGVDEMHQTDINLLISYNIQDCFLDYAIAEYQKIFVFLQGVKDFVGYNLDDTLFNSRTIDMLFLHEAKQNKIALRTKRENPDDEGIKGAVVLEPDRKGVMRNVAVLDEKSFYIMTIISLNMSEETLVVNPSDVEKKNLIRSAIDGVYFRKDKVGFIAKVLQFLLNYRNELKSKVEYYEQQNNAELVDLYNRLQTILKFITNTAYGVFAEPRSRFYNTFIAENITAVSRYIILFTIDYIRKTNYVYYGDTDSIFVSLVSSNIDDMIQEGYNLVNRIDRLYNKLNDIFNFDYNTFEIKLEKIFQTFLMMKAKKKSGDKEDIAKKRYAGLLIWTDKTGKTERLTFTGMKKSDISLLGKEIITHFIKLICYDKTNEMYDYLMSICKNIRSYPLDMLIFQKGIHQSLDTYTNQDWICAARWTNKYSRVWGGIETQTNYGKGSKPKFVYIKKKLLPQKYDPISLIALDANNSLPDELMGCIDYDMIIQKTILDKIETILDAINMKFDLSGRKQLNLFDMVKSNG